MIRSRADFLAYLEADRLALGRESVPPLFLIQDPIWFFQRLLRRLEFYTNCRSGAFWWLLRMWLKFQMKRARLLLGCADGSAVLEGCPLPRHAHLELAHLGLEGVGQPDRTCGRGDGGKRATRATPMWCL